MQTANDQLMRFIFTQQAVRGAIVKLNSSYQAALINHQYPGEVASLLGKSLAAVTMLISTIKFKGRLIIQLQTNGIVKTLVAQSNQQLQIRGMAKYSIENVTQRPLLGDGQLVLTLVDEQSADQHQGIVHVSNNSLELSLENYFRQSEQLNTRIWLFANSSTCAGLMLQEMPDCDTNFFEHLNLLTDTLKAEEILSLDFTSILNRLYVEETIEVFNPDQVCFKCSCDKQKMQAAIKTLGYEEANQVFVDQPELQVTCEFCNSSYNFNSSEITKIFQ